MRPADLSFLLASPTAGVGAFLAGHGWLAAIVATALLWVLIRVVNFALGELKRAGGYTGWQKERYAAVPDREEARDHALRGEERRRMMKLEAKQQRSEYKRSARTSGTGQLRFWM